MSTEHADWQDHPARLHANPDLFFACQRMTPRYLNALGDSPG